ncbi:hypothetical protein [Pelomonas sp. KK5]|uniref:hypothetical protein n=1 Tax=Pelomonas sp. KK5 TaxID=1855730 RepID=UPI00097C6565|nr:hypothetical protein [Pelomonas sp. KK5]
MTPALLFQLHLILGYAAWLLCFRTYLWPRLRAMEAADAHRAIATLHGFRFFGLAFLMPGVVSPDLPASFAGYAAYGDLATGLLALAALAAYRVRPLFWLFVAAFNVAGLADLIGDYVHAVQLGLPEMAGRLGVLYPVPVIYVPLLMITHLAAIVLVLRGRRTLGQ